MLIIETKEKILLIGIAVITIITIGVFLSKSEENDLSKEEVIAEQKNIPSQSPSTANEQPYAWVEEGYVGKIGESIEFDASGSYDPSGAPLTLYEWDFDADGVFDYQSPKPYATHTYNNEFNDLVTVRVTSPNGTASASTLTVINVQGYVSQGNETPCKLDENGYSIFINEKGQFLPCAATNLPTTDKPGVVESQGAPSDLE